MDKYLIRKARTQDSSLVQYIKLLLLSIYKIFFLLDCVIYACWGTPWKKFLELPLMTTIPMNIQIFTHPLPHLEFVKALHILLEHVTSKKEEDSFGLKTGLLVQNSMYMACIMSILSHYLCPWSQPKVPRESQSISSWGTFNPQHKLALEYHQFDHFLWLH